MLAYYRNETLFSEIYLEEITRQPEQAEVLASLKVLREYRAYADTASLEAWTKTYIHEVLAALGFNAQSKKAGLTLLYPVGSVGQPVSLCVITLPGESLDTTLLGRNWAEKTIRALRQEGLQWGLLTNGSLWRIYHLDEATPYETYLEIDLESILADQAKDAYQILYLFMKAGNFTAGEDGKCQFDRFKKESKNKIDYIEKELANALRQREEAGKGVLSDLCIGYVEEIRSLPHPSPAGEGEDLDDEMVRRKIYHGAMLYMFRLLFLLYAEARGLLSDENHALLLEVEAEARAWHSGGTSSGISYALWERLSAIFVDIDQTYNGGLFSPQESEFTRFIEETRVADRYLVETLFNLITYHERNGQEHPISYRDMNVRHLGTLYEGLLEHKLFITKEDTEVRLTKGKIEFIPVSRGGKLVRGQTLPTGAVYFGSDPSERKSTGSFYTPEYIVDYIVRNTVGEKLKELKAEFLREEKANLDALRHAVDGAERLALASLLEESALRFVREKILTLSVLDPAMGSGHFLVNVANLIANFITEFLNELEIEGETPTGTAYWRRWVVENCLYGVDINPLAVELAKLSLWILSMAKDHPLSFMNHHFKCGNSLVGARLDEIGNYPFSTAKREPRQLRMFERDPNLRTAVEDALAKSRLIASRASITLEDVEEKKAWLAEIEADLKGYKAICNVHTGLYFGQLVDENDYNNLVEKCDFARAYALEKNNQYFHWELEFPEIFLNLHSQNLGERCGFDIVIGNPPYGASFTSADASYFTLHYNTFGGIKDVYTCFIEKTIANLISNGRMSFIVPSGWTGSPQYTNIRSVFLSYEFEKIVLLPFDVFEAAFIDTLILLLRNNYPSSNHLVQTFIYPKREKIISMDIQEYKLVKQNDWVVNEDKKIVLDPETIGLLKNISKTSSRTLHDVCLMRRGVLFDSSILTNDHISESYYRYFEGDVYRYKINMVIDRWVEFGEKIKEKPKELFWFEGQRLLLRRLVNRRQRLMASITEKNFITNKNLYSIIPQQIDGKVLLGVINSRLLSYLYINQVTQAAKDDFPQVTIKDILSLPFPSDQSLKKTAFRLVPLVERILMLHEESPQESDKQELLRREIESTDATIDHLVYELYGLTVEEIAIVEAKG